jgi:hypothetical protein
LTGDGIFTTETRRHVENQIPSQNLSDYPTSDQRCDIKVNNDANALASQLEISKQLCVVDWQEVLDAFQFENDFILNDEVQSIPAIQLYAFVFDGQGHLALKSQPTEVEFVTQTLLISRLEKAWTKRPMHFDGGSNDLLG